MLHLSNKLSPGNRRLVRPKIVAGMYSVAIRRAFSFPCMEYIALLSKLPTVSKRTERGVHKIFTRFRAEHQLVPAVLCN